jgi:iron complex transport system substrate-binding protein
MSRITGKSLALLVALVILQACSSREKVSSREKHISPSATDLSGPEYAQGFIIERYRDFSLLHVMDPWQGSNGIHMKYLVTSIPDRIPDSLIHLPAVKTPVSRVICMSTTHIAMIDALGMTETIVGISGPAYISNPDVRSRVGSGKVLDVGADQALSYERIVSLKPDVVIAYGITAEVTGMVRRLGELGIPVILNGDYLETKPLGKTEWIRFMAVFYGMEKEADSIFEGIREEYDEFRCLAASVDERPSVMTGLPWKDAWYISGGQSFAAAFIEDAGGDYLWADSESHEASPFDLESVYARAANADIWINSGSARSLDDIRRSEARLSKFKPFREERIYNNTARLNPEGGNDFWESGVMKPHLVLADLIRIFHPDLLPGHDLLYYERLHR